MSVGSVALVGAGPGDPDLLTVKALRLIREAGVLVFDRLVSPEILELVPPGISRIYAGKALNRHHMVQDEINRLLVSLAKAGHRVVRLKGGDPFIFGRGSEEAEILAQAGIPFEVVPGISAASGCSAYAGIPLTHRGLATGVRFLAGHHRENQPLDYYWPGLVDERTTLVLYMAMTNLTEISAELMAAGMDGTMPVAVVQNGTTPRQRRLVTILAELPARAAAEGIGAPALVIIGRVVKLADTLTWFAPCPSAQATA